MAEAKYLTRKTLREEELLRVHGLRRWPIVAGKAWQQGPEGAAHTVSTVRKQREGERMIAGAQLGVPWFAFYSIWTASS